MSKGRCLFYRWNPEKADINTAELPEGLTLKLWNPTLTSIKPEGFSLFPSLVWWCFHIFRIFNSYKYHIWYVSDQAWHLVHRSVAFPGFFRFPFMQKGDLQLGDIWTDSAYRGKRIAVTTLITALKSISNGTDSIWYVTEEQNVISQKLAESIGFELYARGAKQKRFGLKLLGYYDPSEIVQPKDHPQTNQEKIVNE